MIKKSVKFLFFLFISSSFLYAGLIDGISVIVNNTPITLVEIRDLSQRLHIPTKEAIQILIQQKIEDNLIKKYGITVDSMDIDDEMEKISSQAGMSIMDFQNFLEKKGINITQYKKDLAQKIRKEKLYKKISSSKIKQVSLDEVKNYYKSHKDIYSVPQMIDVIQYSSSDKSSLQKAISNPMLNIKNIKKSESVLKSQNINPKLLYILQQTKEGSFTPVLTLQNGFTSFYVKRKINVKPLPFDQVKNRIFARMMDKREKNGIKSYFDKLISEAKIKVIREP